MRVIITSTLGATIEDVEVDLDECVFSFDKQTEALKVEDPTGVVFTLTSSDLAFFKIAHKFFFGTKE